MLLGRFQGTYTALPHRISDYARQHIQVKVSTKAANGHSNTGPRHTCPFLLPRTKRPSAAPAAAQLHHRCPQEAWLEVMISCPRLSVSEQFWQGSLHHSVRPTQVGRLDTFLCAKHSSLAPVLERLTRDPLRCSIAPHCVCIGAADIRSVGSPHCSHKRLRLLGEHVLGRVERQLRQDAAR